PGVAEEYRGRAGVGGLPMRRPKGFVLAAVLAAALACWDRSRTSPMATANAAPSEAVAAFDPVPVSRARNTTVLSPRGQDPLPQGIWGSAQASLAVGPTTARLQILSATLPMGGCFGQYADIVRNVPGGRFTLPGTFTQLIGAYPGKVDYGAQFSGTVTGDTLTITVTVPQLQQTHGPYTLVRGVTNSWTPCLYPGCLERAASQSNAVAHSSPDRAPGGSPSCDSIRRAAYRCPCEKQVRAGSLSDGSRPDRRARTPKSRALSAF